MHYYINGCVKCVLDGCSMLAGMLFQLNWTPVPTYLEQGSNLAVTSQELQKLTASAYRMENERSCFYLDNYDVSKERRRGSKEKTQFSNAKM